MADGNAIEIGGGAVETCISPDEAIERLEAGKEVDGIVVDLGKGVLARPDGPLGAVGLLQRLKAFKLLKSMAKTPCRTLASSAEQVRPDPHVKALLDAVAKAR